MHLPGDHLFWFACLQGHGIAMSSAKSRSSKFCEKVHCMPLDCFVVFLVTQSTASKKIMDDIRLTLIITSNGLVSSLLYLACHFFIEALNDIQTELSISDHLGLAIIVGCLI